MFVNVLSKFELLTFLLFGERYTHPMSNLSLFLSGSSHQLLSENAFVKYDVIKFALILL